MYLLICIYTCTDLLYIANTKIGGIPDRGLAEERYYICIYISICKSIYVYMYIYVSFKTRIRGIPDRGLAEERYYKCIDIINLHIYIYICIYICVYMYHSKHEYGEYPAKALLKKGIIHVYISICISIYIYMYEYLSFKTRIWGIPDRGVAAAAVSAFSAAVLALRSAVLTSIADRVPLAILGSGAVPRIERGCS